MKTALTKSGPRQSSSGRIPRSHRGEGGSTPTLALQLYHPRDLIILPIPPLIARRVCERGHYLHSYPGASIFNFGVFAGGCLYGVVVIGCGPTNLRRLFLDARRDEVLCLSRMWLDDRLGRNCESRTLSVIVRYLRKNQATVKALVAYSDPMAGHRGTIYKAAGFLYLGESESMPLYRLPDGSVTHSRTLSHSYGTHSRRYFAARGIKIELVEQSRKLTYVALIDPSWRQRLTRPPLAYPRAGGSDGSHRDTP